MNRLLINEPPLQVLPSLAKLIGLNEAIFLQQLHYWLIKSQHEYDGRKWVYNTFEEWQKQLPFWSIITIKRIVQSLRKAGLVSTTAQYNKMQVDRTLWYTIDYAAVDSLAERTVDTSIVSTCYDGKCQVDTTNNQRLPETYQTTSVPAEPSRSFPCVENLSMETTPPLSEVEVTTHPSEVVTSTAHTPLAVQFRTLTDELRTAKNKAALLMQIYILCYGVDSAVTFAYLGKVAKQVGGAGYLAQRLWELSVRPPNGDVLAYIQSEHKSKAARQKEVPKASAATLFDNQEIPDYIKEMQV